MRRLHELLEAILAALYDLTQEVHRMSDQQSQLDADVNALTEVFTALSQELANQQQNQAAGQPVDLSGLDALVSRFETLVPAPTSSGATGTAGPDGTATGTPGGTGTDTGTGTGTETGAATASSDTGAAAPDTSGDTAGTDTATQGTPADTGAAAPSDTGADQPSSTGGAAPGVA